MIESRFMEVLGNFLIGLAIIMGLSVFIIIPIAFYQDRHSEKLMLNKKAWECTHTRTVAKTTECVVYERVW